MGHGVARVAVLGVFLGWAGECGIFSEADRRAPVEVVARGSVILISSGVDVALCAPNQLPAILSPPISPGPRFA